MKIDVRTVIMAFHPFLLLFNPEYYFFSMPHWYDCHLSDNL